MMKLTPKDLAALAKKKGVKKIDRISAAEYRELCASKSDKSGRAPKGSTDGSNRRSSFAYNYEVEIIDGGYRITLEGRHYTVNELHYSFSVREKSAFSKAIKKAAHEWMMRNRKIHKSIKPMEKATVEYYFYNPSSRDSDNNSVKNFQDTFSVPTLKGPGVLGLILDDKRKVLRRVRHHDDEILDRTYKIVAILREGWHDAPRPDLLHKN